MTVYLVGETVTFDDARAESLIARGLVESAEAVEEDIILNDDTPADDAPAVDDATIDEETPVEEVNDDAEVADEAPADEVKEDNQPEASPRAVKPVATRRKNASKDN